MGHDQPVKPDGAVEGLEEVVEGGGISQVVAGTPEVRRVETEGDPAGLGPLVQGRAADAGQLLDRGAHPVPAARRVLEDEERWRAGRGRPVARAGPRFSGPAGGLGEDAGDPRPEACEAGRLPRPAV